MQDREVVSVASECVICFIENIIKTLRQQPNVNHFTRKFMAREKGQNTEVKIYAHYQKENHRKLSHSIQGFYHRNYDIKIF